MTDQRIVLVHTVPFADPDRLKQSCTSVAWVRKLLNDLNTEGVTATWDSTKVPTYMERLRDAQILLDGLVLACLVELDSEGTK